MSERGILIFVILLGVSVHALVLYCCHNRPLHHPLTFVHPLTYLEEEAFNVLQRKERSHILGHIFDHLTTAEPEVKESLQELTAEFAVAATVEFPEGEPFLITESAFALEQDPLDFALSAEGECVLWESESCILTSTQLFSADLPIVTDFLRPHPTYEGLGSIAKSDHFDIQVEYAQKQHRPGYVFKVTFLPKQEICFKRIQQNYYFLIDRSNSIPRNRYALNKAAVSAALDYMKPQDTFNILIFDDKVCRLSPHNLRWNAENVALARAFLEKQGHGGYFAATELYSSLGKIIPEHVNDTEVNTAILLSDGDTYLSAENQRQTIGGWTANNRGKVALYAVASGGGNNLSLLELITSFNKGDLIYSYDHTQLHTLLATLMCSIRNPIGKQMVATAIAADKQTVVLLQPKEHLLPDLYQNRPFVIYGSTNRLCDFVLFLQGKYYDRSFDIKKRISFTEATYGSFEIEQGWTQLVVQEFYNRFFEDGNRRHLEAAKQLLTPLNLPLLLQ